MGADIGLVAVHGRPFLFAIFSIAVFCDKSSKSHHLLSGGTSTSLMGSRITASFFARRPSHWGFLHRSEVYGQRRRLLPCFGDHILPIKALPPCWIAILSRNRILPV